MYECLNIDCLRRFKKDVYETKAKAYEKATEPDRQDVSEWMAKELLLYLEKRSELLEAYEKETELNPKNAKAWLGKGSVLSSLGRHQESLEAYEKATEVDPEDDLGLLGKARALHYLQRHQEALGAYEKVIELAPKDFVGWLGKGLALLHLQRYQEALEAYQKATEVEARHAEAWLGKGRALYMLERYEEALEAFENATEIDPRAVVAWRDKTLALDRLGRYQEAKEASMRANKLETKHSEEAEGVRYLTNPLLLGVRMFLADIRSWRRQYIEGVYVCDDFTKEVCEAATERGIRCGYATVYFEASNVAHAIVAFDTDYGLKFIELQSGEEEIVGIGKPYPVIMDGVPQNAIVTSIEISWNDGSVQSIP